MINHANQPSKDLLGLAVLDAELQILADVVVDLTSVIRGAQDFRLFALGTTIANNKQIYISSNDMLIPLWIIPDNTPKELTKLPVMFEGGLDAWVASSRLDVLCSPCAKMRSCGKNFQFFESNNKLWSEVWPSSPHLIRSIYSPCERKKEPTFSFSTGNAPAASFRNKEVDAFAGFEGKNPRRRAKGPPWLTRGRGSACCLPVKHPQTGEALSMGISHSKTLGTHGMQANHYLSQLYAFSNEPPFALVAESGYFCLPFPSIEEHVIQTVNISRWRVLSLGNGFIYPDCPRIHFISGMVFDADDEDKVIISFGVNDCYSRFVQVSLSGLLDLLFNGVDTT